MIGLPEPLHILGDIPRTICRVFRTKSTILSAFLTSWFVSLFQSLLCAAVVFRLKILNVIKIIYLYRISVFQPFGFRLVRLAFGSAVPHQYRNFKSKSTHIITSRLPPFRFLASCLVARTDSRLLIPYSHSLQRPNCKCRFFE